MRDGDNTLRCAIHYIRLKLSTGPVLFAHNYSLNYRLITYLVAYDPGEMARKRTGIAIRLMVKNRKSKI